MEQVQATINSTDLTTDLASSLETAIDSCDWIQVCQLAEQSIFSNRLPESEILNALLQALEWGDFQVRWDVSKILPKLGTIAIEPLINLLQEDEGEELQWFVVRALGAWENDQVMQALLKVLKSGNPELQSIAATVLAQYGDRVLILLKELLKEAPQPPNLGEQEIPKPPKLGVGGGSPEPTLSKLWSARILANIRTIGTIEHLLVLAVDDDPEVCCVAIEALMSFQDDRISTVLIQLLQSIHSSIRKTSAEAIGFCQSLSLEKRIELLTPLLSDFNVSVCVKTAASLGRLGEGATVPLLKSLNSSPLPIPLETELVRSLLRIANPIALAGLFECAQQSVTVRYELLRSLGRIQNLDLKPICVNYLIDLMQTGLTVSDRKLAVTALGHLEQPSAIDCLVAQLVTPDAKLRLHILQALQQIDRTLEQPIVLTKIVQKLQDISNQDASNFWRSGLKFAISEWR